MAKIQNKRNTGFTILELLAVIVILAVLAVIVIPLFSNKSTETKKIAHNENIRMLQKQAQSYLLDQVVIPTEGIDITDSMVSDGKLKKSQQIR